MAQNGSKSVEPKVTAINALQPEAARRDWSVKGNPGLVVRVWPSGTKVFLHRFKQRGVSFRVTLGNYPAMTLASALAEFHAQRLQLQRGENPALQAQRAAHAEAADPTVNQLALRYLTEHAKPRKRSAREDERVLQRDVLPRWGKLQAREITFADVDAMVARIRDAKGRGVTAPRKALAVVRKMFSFAVKRRILPMNPATGVDAPPQPPPRKRSLSDAELRAFLQSLPSSGLSDVMCDALQLQLLTASRIGEVLGMRPEELDLDAAIWTLPQERAKNKLTHIVPLTAPAIAIVRRRLAAARGGYLFPGHREKGALRVDSLAHALARQLDKFHDSEGKPLAAFVSHDLRRTVETGLARLAIGREIRDRVLNHKDASVGAVHYNSHDYLPEKRAALETWSRHLDGIVNSAATNVVAIKSGKSR